VELSEFGWLTSTPILRLAPAVSFGEAMHPIVAYFQVATIGEMNRRVSAGEASHSIVA